MSPPVRRAVVVFSVLLLVGAAVVALQPTRGSRVVSTRADAGWCVDGDAVPEPLLPLAAQTPVIVEAHGAQVMIDGERAPSRVKPGEHAVTLVGGDAGVLQAIRVRVEAFRPAVFAVEGEPVALVWLGAACVSCVISVQKLDLSPVRAPAVSVEAVAALMRAGKWAEVPDALRAVRPDATNQPAWQRLAAAALWASNDDLRAREMLKKAKWPAMARFEALEKSEREREERVLTDRWNLLTERFSRLTKVAGMDANAPVAAASARMAELSQGFSLAVELHDAISEDETVRTGEQTVLVFLKAARAARPGDCGFQQRLSKAL